MKYSGIGSTDVGRQRQRNEDSFFVDPDLGLYMVADGIGGYAAGDVASRMAIECVATYLHERREVIEAIKRTDYDEARLSSLAAAAVAHASISIYQKSRSDHDLAGMGCTLTVLLLGRRAAAMAHVGDSRLYLLRQEQVRQLSKDHSLANELVDLGVISADQTENVRGGRVLTRSIGRKQNVAVEQLLIDVRAGDFFVLCTDGLSNYLAEEDDLHRLLAIGRFESCPRRMIDFANASGGDDNITAVVVRIDDVEPVGVDAPTESVAIQDSGQVTMEMHALAVGQ